MRGLTLFQPWAQLIALGEKHVETRNWSTAVRDTIAIHASGRIPTEMRDLFGEEPFRSLLKRHGYAPHWEAFDTATTYGTGVVVATARIVTVRPTRLAYGELSQHERALGDYSDGRYAWFLADVHRLAEPIPCKGALGLWRVPPDGEARIWKQIEEART